MLPRHGRILTESLLTGSDSDAEWVTQMARSLMLEIRLGNLEDSSTKWSKEEVRRPTSEKEELKRSLVCEAGDTPGREPWIGQQGS